MRKHWQILGAGLAAVAIAGLAPIRAGLQDVVVGQTPAGLALVYGIDRFGWVLVALLAGAGSVVLVDHWRRSGGRLALIVPLAALIGGIWVFAESQRLAFPLMDGVRYARAAEVDFLEDNDMVMGVVVDGQAVAYPNAIVAYHHVVNDVVGGVRLLLTY